MQTLRYREDRSCWLHACLEAQRQLRRLLQIGLRNRPAEPLEWQGHLQQPSRQPRLTERIELQITHSMPSMHSNVQGGLRPAAAAVPVVRNIK